MIINNLDIFDIVDIFASFRLSDYMFQEIDEENVIYTVSEYIEAIKKRCKSENQKKEFIEFIEYIEKRDIEFDSCDSNDYWTNKENEAYFERKLKMQGY